MSKPVYLVDILDKGHFLEIPGNGRPFKIGRNPKAPDLCNFVVFDQGVSKHHGTIRNNPGNQIFYYQESNKETYIGTDDSLGELAEIQQPTFIAPGTVLRLGSNKRGIKIYSYRDFQILIKKMGDTTEVLTREEFERKYLRKK